MKRLAVVFVVLHGPGGATIEINPDQVTSLRHAPPEQHGEYFTEEANCMIGLTDGKFVTVTEDCETVRKLFEQRARP